MPEATNTGRELNFDQNVTKAWKLNLNGNRYRDSIRGYAGQIDFPTAVTYVIASQRDNPWILKTDNLLTFSPRVKGEVGGTYFSDKDAA